MSFAVQGKVCLVTGANRGIGKALTEGLLEHGAAKVYAAVRNPASLQELQSQWGERLVPITLDLADPATIQAAAEQATDVELVINNAGVLQTASALDSTAVDSLRMELDINVFGLIHMAQAFAPVLKSNGGGAFVQLKSVASMQCFPDFATYSASKAAAYSITLGLRQNLGEQGTQVVSIHPGPIATDMAHAAGLGEIAEPPSVVTTALLAALAEGTFHAWPDAYAKQIGSAYQSFAEQVILAAPNEGA